MIDTIRNQRILVVVAHADDEALFAACAIRKLVDAGNQVWIQVVTSIADCNTIRDDPSAESLRQQKRAAAFVDSCRLLGAWPLPNLDLPNAKDVNEYTATGSGMMYHCIAKVVRAFRFALVITHGDGGESGHAQHTCVHRTTKLACEDQQCPMLTFSPDGPISVPIDHDFKQRVLACYRYGCTRTPEWRPTPQTNPELAPWLTDFERFDLWPAQPG